MHDKIFLLQLVWWQVSDRVSHRLRVVISEYEIPHLLVFSLTSWGDAKHFFFEHVLISPSYFQFSLWIHTISRFRFFSVCTCRHCWWLFNLMDSRQKLEPPLLVPKRLRVYDHIDLLTDNTLSKVCLQNVAIVLRCSIFEQHDHRSYEKASI